MHHWFGENPSGTPTADDGTGDGIKLSYDRGPFGAVASYMRTKFATGDVIFRNVGLIYNFGPVILSANYNHDQQGGLSQEGALLGARWIIGPGEVKGSYSYLKTSAPNSPKGEKLALGYVHNLSKRTAAYTTVAHIRNHDGVDVCDRRLYDRARSLLDRLRHRYPAQLLTRVLRRRTGTEGERAEPVI